MRSLRNSGKDVFLIGTSIYDDSVAPAFCDVFEQAVPTDDAGYMEWLVSTIRRHCIDMLIPGIEADLYKWVEHIPEIEDAGAKPLLNAPHLIHLCKDKWAFFLQLKAAGMSCAIESSLDQDFGTLQQKYGLPFLLKPRRGFGSKGIVRIDGRETFMKYRQEIGPQLMAQPVVGNDEEEYTTAAFCDGRGGYLASITLKRKLSHDGFTEKAEVVNMVDFRETVFELCQRFQPVGPTNFQFRMCTDGPKLLEINPRISSSTSIRTAFGYNESAMAVEYFLEQRTPSQPLIRRGRAVRYTDEHIFYEDDIICAQAATVLNPTCSDGKNSGKYSIPKI